MVLQPGGVKIWRPRQLYIGETERDYVDIEARKEVKPKLGHEPTEVPHSFSKRAFLAEYKDRRFEQRSSKI